jgi:hypothetical protein
MNDQTIVIPATPGTDDPAFAAGQAAEAARNAAEKANEARTAGEAAQAAVSQAGTTLEAMAGSLTQLETQQAAGFRAMDARLSAVESRIAFLDEVAAEMDADEVGEDEEETADAEDDEEATRAAAEAEATERENRAAPKGRHRSGTPWL